MFSSRTVSAALLLLGLAGQAPAQVPQDLFSRRIAGGFTDPLYAVSPPGDPTRLWVVQRGGLIRVLNTVTGAIDGTFLDLANVPNSNLIFSGQEQGLLGLAFHPDYLNNGKFYVNYITNNGAAGPNFTRVQEFTRSGNPLVADPNSGRVVMQFQQPFDNHNGGWLSFAPTRVGVLPSANNNLYIASGDGGSSNDPNNNAQNRNSFLGKMLRVDVGGADDFADPNLNYHIPANNPFVGQQNVRQEIWAYGLRNPWRNAFDRRDSHLWIADVGQAAWEEINFQHSASQGGENYGWRPLEGNHDNPDVSDPEPQPNVRPIHEYNHSVGQSITGGYVYRGADLKDPINSSSLNGAYFFGDFIQGRIWTLRMLAGGGIDVDERTNVLRNSVDGFVIGNPSSFGEDGFGNLYVIDFGQGAGAGEVFLISGTPVPEPGLLLAGACAAGVWLWRHRRPSATPVGDEPDPTEA